MKKVTIFFNREQNLLIHIIATIFVVIFGIILKIDDISWLLVLFSIMFVISSELINSAIELSVDLYTNKYNEFAKIAKDTSAAAVVISAFCALIIGIYVFLPKIVFYLND